MLRRLLIAAALMLGPSAPAADSSSSARIEAALAWADSLHGRITRDELEPRWLPDGESFSYDVATGPDGAREHVLVHAPTGTIRRAATADALDLPAPHLITVSSLPADDTPRRSRRTGRPVRLELINTCATAVRLFWLDQSGERKAYGEIAPGARLERSTYAGHVWLLESASGEVLARFAAETSRSRLVIDGPAAGPAAPDKRRSFDAPRTVSPNSRWDVAIVNHNVVLRHFSPPGPELVLTTDGTAEHPYVGPAVWTSRAFVLTRVARVPVRRITLVESAPRDQLQPRTREIDYIKPGDPLPDPTPVIFTLPAAGDEIAPGSVTIRPIDRTLCPSFFTSDGTLDYRWSADEREVFFNYNQRGHQLYRILAINAATAAVRTVVEERAEAFVDYTNKTWRHWLPDDRGLIWLSERDGFAHLWCIDASGSTPPRQLTRGHWVVRRVEYVDVSAGRIWFWASGLRPEEDPYHLHLCRINLDGTGFVRLTEGDGTHRVDFSPDRRWFVDTWSRVDQPPVSELRRSSDGGLVTTLETADASALLAAGWSRPERFTAPGRDGTTPIHGIIIRPRDFNPSRAYPVIEEVYAGPHDAFAPKSFSVLARQQAFAALGYVVVQSDGMGTNHRGRAFHAVAWKNLKDAGFPDRIAWMRSAAATRPWMDVSRVGIYGGSAGGQSAMRALLDHSDFYSAAFADCGCHDNRMDKIWWNEQWLGWPLGESYIASSNVEDAARLKGRLFLMVGEQDTNVDPSSTLQVVDRLVRAGKDFEFLLLPGVGHGAAETPYGTRRRLDFFLRNLPPPSSS